MIALWPFFPHLPRSVDFLSLDRIVFQEIYLGKQKKGKDQVSLLVES